MPEDIFLFLNNLDQERYRSAILHASPDKGQAVTEFARKVCLKTGGKYLDLLEYFIKSEELSQTIDTYGPDKLRTLLIQQSKLFTLLVVDRADFLLDTWRKQERKIFYQLFDDLWDSFKDGMQAKLLICLQTSGEIEGLKTGNPDKLGRVRRLADFNDIA